MLVLLDVKPSPSVWHKHQLKGCCCSLQVKNIVMVPISGFISSSSLMNNMILIQQQQEILVNVSGGWGLREHRQRISHVSLPWSQTVRGSSLVCVCVCVVVLPIRCESSFFPQQSVRLQLVSTLRLIFHSYNPCDERWLEPPGGSVRAKGVQHLKSVLGGHTVFSISFGFCNKTTDAGSSL